MSTVPGHDADGEIVEGRKRLKGPELHPPGLSMRRRWRVPRRPERPVRDRIAGRGSGGSPGALRRDERRRSRTGGCPARRGVRHRRPPETRRVRAAAGTGADVDVLPRRILACRVEGVPAISGRRLARARRRVGTGRLSPGPGGDARPDRRGCAGRSWYGCIETGSTSDATRGASTSPETPPAVISSACWRRTAGRRRPAFRETSPGPRWP